MSPVHQHNPDDVFQAKDAIMEMQPTCEFGDFLYHLVNFPIVDDIFVGLVPGSLEHHLRLVLEHSPCVLLFHLCCYL